MQALDTLKFQPNTLTVAPGQKVTINLKNMGTIDHDIISPGLGLANEVTVASGKSAQVTFTAPNQPGTYDFWCQVIGHGEAGMTGQVIVK